MDASSADSTSASASAPDSMKMTTEDGLEQEMELAPDSMEMMTEDGVEQEMEMVPDISTSESLEPDSVEVVVDVVTPYSVEVTVDVVEAPDSINPLLSVDGLDSVIAQDSVEMVPDSLPPGAFVCGRCGLVHEDRQAWDRAHSRSWPCSRCGLVHLEYMVLAMIYGQREFDCNLFIPNLDEHVMQGDRIMLPPHVIKKLDELDASKDDNKASVR